ncbi:MAG TPA: alkaline phosphatase family protein [Alphaproteobacteria bacterium]|nr:alkaline phosphatase family protein [Alphaproteobacteria bacterium]
MIEIPRRRFLRGAAVLGGAAVFGVPARGIGSTAPGKLTDIDYFIILTKENRSFDHYFGTLAGVRGFGDPSARRQGHIFEQVDEERGRRVLPFHLDTRTTNAQRLVTTDHTWGGQHAAWNGGKLDQWISGHRSQDGAHAAITMGYYTRADIPFYYALADAFTICDGYHCSVMGPTHPNRYYLMTGTIDPEGKAGGPGIDNSPRNFRWESYPERLERAGVSWRIYHDLDDYNCNVVRFLAQYKNLPRSSSLWENAMRTRPFYELLWDIRTANIPQVSWIVPPSFESEHPDFLPAYGERHTQRILEALWSNPKLWARTALIINYDENDGLFDHVSPPTPEPGASDEYVGGLPVGLGFRVPCLVISPWSRGGYVCHDTFDHTSTLRLIETRFGVEVPNLSKWRRGVTGDLTSAFSFAVEPRNDVPALPETEKALAFAEEGAMALQQPSVPEEPQMPAQETGSRPTPQTNT